MCIRHLIAGIILLSLQAEFALADPNRADAEPIPIRMVSGNRSNKARTGLAKPIAFPDHTTFYLRPPKCSWANIGVLDFEVVWPGDGPTHAQVLVHLQDWDYYWYQNLLPGTLIPGKVNRFEVDLSPTAEAWHGAGHYASWHLRARMEPKAFGIRVFGDSKYAGSCVLTNVYGVPRKESGAPVIRNVRPNAAKVPCYGKFELTFDLPDRYTDPFDAKQVLVVGGFMSPSGKLLTVDGYYGRDYYREVDAAGERVFAQGPPYWRIRFCPTEKGRYTYSLRVKDDYGESEWGPSTFDATDSSAPGFVRVSKKDPRYFEYDEGDYYFPIGHNIRSPFDTRADKQFPWVQRWPEGSAAYTRYFKDMNKHGENLAEIWSSAWSLGLEWASRRPGYHGIGQYNMKNAWETDQVVKHAEKHRIHLNYVVHNHGKFGTFYDHEWELNPFNKINGGYLDTPEEYFTDTRALDDFRKLMRYTVSRWGYSTSIFAWELWSELNLTGSDRKETNYRRPEVVEWHRIMGREVKKMDPYAHLVGTHVSGDYTKQNKAIISLPEMDYCPIDAYHFSGSALHIVELMRRTAVFNNPYEKPVLITEFGGSHMAANVKHLEDTLHAAIWASTCIPLGGTPMFWWWQIIEEENFYPHFAAVQKFMADEDRRDPDMLMAQAELVVPGGGTADLLVRCLKSKRRALGWIYRNQEFEHIDLADGPTVSDLSIRLRGMDAGSYGVECWDTLKGTCVSRSEVSAENGVMKFDVPPFARDLAFKIRKKGQETVP